jgi:hypothetical protein
MRSHVLSSWLLLLSACSYDFAGADGATAAGGASTSTGDMIAGSSGSNLPLDTSASSTQSSASSAASSSTGPLVLPDPIPPCGGVTDDFEDDMFDDTIWSRSFVDGDVREEQGYLQLQTFGGSAPVAQLELDAVPVAPCTFGFAIDFDTMTIGLRSADGTRAIGLSSVVSGDQLLVHRDGVDEASSSLESPEGVAVVLLSDRVVLLAHEGDEQPWFKVLDEPRASVEDWLATAKALVFTHKPNEEAEVDDYGIRPVRPLDL